jgi:hypothetical protein
MSTSKEQKCSSFGRSSPLFDLDILQHVLSYVGLGHHLFVAPVSKCWRLIYARLDGQQLTVYDDYSKRIITCGPQMTLHSAVLASPARVKLAHESGLSCSSCTYQRAAGEHADVATLTTAHQLGVEYKAG